MGVGRRLAITRARREHRSREVLLKALLLVALCCALPSSLHAQSEELGARGQWLIAGSAGGSFRTQHWQAPEDSDLKLYRTDELRLWFAPRALLFVAKDFAVGVAIGIGMERSFREDDLELAADGFGGSLLLAYHAALGSNVFLLPELGLGASYRRRTVEGPSIPFTLATGRLVQLPTPPVEHSAPVLHASFSLPAAILLAPRFYLGAGPYVQVEWGDALATPRGDDLRIAIGLSTLFGTWL